MNRVIKCLLIVFAVFLTVMVAVLFVVPAFIDINDYKPRLQEELTKITGRKVVLGGDVDLSLFPWAGVSVSDVTLGNPSGFDEKKFVSIKSFEAQIKLLPLLSKDIQIKRFILKEPHIVLIKNAAGNVNWEISPESSKPDQQKPKQEDKADGLFPADLTVNEFAITDGSVIYINETDRNRTEINDINFIIYKISLDEPVSIEFDAMVTKIPISVDGDIGPIGKQIGENDIFFDLDLSVSKQLTANITGKLKSPIKKPGVDLNLQINPFSFRDLSHTIGMKDMIKTSDPTALNNISMTASVTGNSEKIAISNALLEMDNSKIEFSATAEDFKKPVATFDIYLNHIDLDRYLPATEQTPPATNMNKGTTKAAASPTPIPYAQFRKLVVNGKIRADKIKLHNTVVENVIVKLTGKNGQFKLDPLSMNLYKGELIVNGSLDINHEKPQSQVTINGKNIEIGLLINDVAQKEFMEGTAQIDAFLTTRGDDIDFILKGLNGNGAILVEDGAVKGINVEEMVQHIKAAYLKFKGSEPSQKQDFSGRTDFSRLHAPFEIKNGLAATDNTSLTAPGLRLTATGNADLVNQTLNFKLSPKFVATIQGQGDKDKRSGITVPILVQGSFSSPVFRPDMKSMIEEGINLLPEIQKRFLKEKETKSTDDSEADKTDEKPLDQIKNLLRSLPK
jgi:AsmA protein